MVAATLEIAPVPLKIELKPFERLLIGGAAIEFSSGMQQVNLPVGSLLFATQLAADNRAAGPSNDCLALDSTAQPLLPDEGGSARSTRRPYAGDRDARG